MTIIYPNYNLEKSYNNSIVIGIDEAGRGPLAGPVVASCVLLDEVFLSSNICNKINDSKKISAKIRKEIFLHLCKNIKFGIGIVDEEKIDEINILEASKLAMFIAYKNFCQKYNIFPEIILVDGNFLPFAAQDKIINILPIVKGDQKSLSIAAASIIAKETRDEIMNKLHQEYPQFLWNKNAGYPTKLHINKIKEFGICKYHRKSFEPIKSMIKS